MMRASQENEQTAQKKEEAKKIFQGLNEIPRQDLRNKLVNGEITLNDVRKVYGLEPLEDQMADTLMEINKTAPDEAAGEKQGGKYLCMFSQSVKRIALLEEFREDIGREFQRIYPEDTEVIDAYKKLDGSFAKTIIAEAKFLINLK